MLKKKFKRFAACLSPWDSHGTDSQALHLRGMGMREETLFYLGTAKVSLVSAGLDIVVTSFSVFHCLMV